MDEETQNKFNAIVEIVKCVKTQSDEQGFKILNLATGMMAVTQNQGGDLKQFAKLTEIVQALIVGVDKKFGEINARLDTIEGTRDNIDKREDDNNSDRAGYPRQESEVRGGGTTGNGDNEEGIT